MKKLLFALMLITFSLAFTACEPTTEVGSLNTNITQATTTQATTQTTTGTYIAVTHIEIILDYAEVCVGDQINITVNVTPTNATNQNYTIQLNQTTYVDFANPSNPLILEAIANSTEVVETLVTVISDDNNSIDDTKQVYVHPSASCPVT